VGWSEPPFFTTVFGAGLFALGLFALGQGFPAAALPVLLDFEQSRAEDLRRGWGEDGEDLAGVDEAAG
jgi:hypothetical protein